MAPPDIFYRPHEGLQPDGTIRVFAVGNRPHYYSDKTEVMFASSGNVSEFLFRIVEYIKFSEEEVAQIDKNEVLGSLARFLTNEFRYYTDQDLFLSLSEGDEIKRIVNDADVLNFTNQNVLNRTFLMLLGEGCVQTQSPNDGFIAGTMYFLDMFGDEDFDKLRQLVREQDAPEERKQTALEIVDAAREMIRQAQEQEKQETAI